MHFIKRVFFSFAFLFSFLLLLACLIPYFELGALSFLSLAVPILVIVNIGSLFLCLFLNKKKALLILIILVIGYFSLGSFVQFRLNNKDDSSSEGEFNIMSFNARGFNGYGGLRRPESKEGIIKFLTQENPDIICFQEFDAYIRKKQELREYEHRYVFGPTKADNDKVLQAIYSKYPIIESGVIVFPNSSNQTIFSDLKIGNDTVRIYNVHLESLKVRPKMVGSESSEKLLKRLEISFSKQFEQSNIVNEHAIKSPHPVIICGDFNNTQFSNVYRKIKDNRIDTFMEKGSGYGKTIKFWRFPLRIDFILTDLDFEIKSHKNFNVWLSDHKPIMARLKIKTDK